MYLIELAKEIIHKLDGWQIIALTAVIFLGIYMLPSPLHERLPKFLGGGKSNSTGPK